MKLKNSLLVLAVLAASATAASAAQETPSVYVEANAGISRVSLIGDVAKHKPSLGLTFGTQIDKTFGVEVSYTSFGSRGGMDFDALSIAGTARTNLIPSVDVYGKLGIARTSAYAGVDGTNVGVHDTGFVLGAGVEWSVDKNISLRTGFDVYPKYAGGNVGSLVNVNVGMKYKF